MKQPPPEAQPVTMTQPPPEAQPPATARPPAAAPLVPSQRRSAEGTTRRGPAAQPRPGHDAPPAPPSAPPVSAPPQPQRTVPSWGAVLTNTLRLWAQRRLGWLRRHGWPPRPLRVIAVLLAAAAVYAAGALTVALSRGPVAASPHAAAPARTAAAHGAPAALAAARGYRAQAARWVAQQISGDAIVSCDAVMCAALAAHGVPAARLLVLGAARQDPLGSDVVAATPVVRSHFGRRLATVYAPVTLAAFGPPAERIEIRVVASYGAATYLSSLAADLRARRATGSSLARNPHVQAPATVRGQLQAGDVDSRLLLTLGTLAGLHPITITGFRAAPGSAAGPQVPLRTAGITPAAGPHGRRAPMSALRGFFLAQQPPYRPAAARVVRLAAHRDVLLITYPAPSPPGLLGPTG